LELVEPAPRRIHCDQEKNSKDNNAYEAQLSMQKLHPILLSCEANLVWGDNPVWSASEWTATKRLVSQFCLHGSKMMGNFGLDFRLWHVEI
jgi:hypothetical protein